MGIRIQIEDVTLEQIAADPRCVNPLPADATRTLIAKVEIVRAALRLEMMKLKTVQDPLKARRMVVSEKSETPAEPVSEWPDRLLRVDEAATHLGIARDTLYRNADEYPFTVRVSPRCLRFSEQGIADYMRAKKAGSDGAGSDASEDRT